MLVIILTINFKFDDDLLGFMKLFLLGLEVNTHLEYPDCNLSLLISHWSIKMLEFHYLNSGVDLRNHIQNRNYVFSRGKECLDGIFANV